MRTRAKIRQKIFAKGKHGVWAVRSPRTANRANGSLPEANSNANNSLSVRGREWPANSTVEMYQQMNVRAITALAFFVGASARNAAASECFLVRPRHPPTPPPKTRNGCSRPTESNLLIHAPESAQGNLAAHTGAAITRGEARRMIRYCSDLDQTNVVLAGCGRDGWH